MKFTKMEGLGNDYVYIDCFSNEQKIEDISRLAQIVSNRHFGVGSDGLILICKSNIADFKMRMFNSDGSEAEMCGNGIRCVGKFVYDKGLTKKEKITIETLAGIKRLKLNVEKGEVKTVRVDMGEPILEPEKIPVIPTKNEIPVKNLELQVLDKKFKFTCVSMGNPHAVAFIKGTKNTLQTIKDVEENLNEKSVEEFELEKYGKVVEVDNHFPKKVNVEFIEIVNENYLKMRVWERGSGETLACGTGACASVVATILNGYAKKNTPIIVKLLGGNLEIEWNEKDNHVYMTGPANIVFEGYLIDSEKERK